MSSPRKPQDMPWDLWEKNGHKSLSQVSPALNARMDLAEPPSPKREEA